MTATIDKAHVAGIVTETGGRTSHSAIIARALEIPAVLSVSNSCTALRNGMTVVVDGGKGIVEADPDEEPGENEFRILKQLSVGTDSRKGSPTGKKAEKLK